MNCPYCGKPMEEGYISNPRRDVGIVWYPKNSPPPMVISAKSIKKRGGIPLSSYSFNSDKSKLVSHVCRSCKTGIYKIANDVSPEFYSDWFGRDDEQY